MVKGLRSPDPLQMDLMRTYSASTNQVFWKLRWPASVPFLFASLKVAIAISLVGAIVGELPTGATAGHRRAAAGRLLLRPDRADLGGAADRGRHGRPAGGNHGRRSSAWCCGGARERGRDRRLAKARPRCWRWPPWLPWPSAYGRVGNFPGGGRPGRVVPSWPELLLLLAVRRLAAWTDLGRGPRGPDPCMLAGSSRCWCFGTCLPAILLQFTSWSRRSGCSGLPTLLGIWFFVSGPRLSGVWPSTLASCRKPLRQAVSKARFADLLVPASSAPG